MGQDTRGWAEDEARRTLEAELERLRLVATLARALVVSSYHCHLVEELRGVDELEAALNALGGRNIALEAAQTGSKADE